MPHRNGIYRARLLKEYAPKAKADGLRLETHTLFYLSKPSFHCSPHRVIIFDPAKEGLIPPQEIASWEFPSILPYLLELTFFIIKNRN